MSMRWPFFVQPKPSPQSSARNIRVQVWNSALPLPGPCESSHGRQVRVPGQVSITCTEGVIKSAVSELRQALQGDALLPAWIETVPRRGDRFTGSASRASSKMRRRVPTFG